MIAVCTSLDINIFIGRGANDKSQRHQPSTEKDILGTLIKTRKSNAKDKVKHSENVKTWRRQKSTQTPLHKTFHTKIFSPFIHIYSTLFSAIQKEWDYLSAFYSSYIIIFLPSSDSLSLSLSLLVKYFSSLIFACLRQSENSFNKEANTISHACRNRPHSHSSFKAENEVRILPGL